MVGYCTCIQSDRPRQRPSNPVTSPPDRCVCGSTAFRPVEVDHGPHKPLYRTEFIACSSCGVMYHCHERRTLFRSSGAPPVHEERLPAFRPDVDTKDWTPPPGKVWTEEP